MKFRKKPVIIEAELVSELIHKFSHDWKSLPLWVTEGYEKTTINTITDSGFIVKTLEGDMKATKDDYLIKGVQGEIYPCKIDIFNKTYETVEVE